MLLWEDFERVVDDKGRLCSGLIYLVYQVVLVHVMVLNCSFRIWLRQVKIGNIAWVPDCDINMPSGLHGLIFRIFDDQGTPGGSDNGIIWVIESSR